MCTERDTKGTKKEKAKRESSRDGFPNGLLFDWMCYLATSLGDICEERNIVYFSRKPKWKLNELSSVTRMNNSYLQYFSYMFRVQE